MNRVGKIALVLIPIIAAIGMILIFLGINFGIENGIWYFNINPILLIIGIAIIVVGLPVALMIAKKSDC